MSDVRDSIVYALTASAQLFDRFLSDLTPADYLHRAVPKANCAAWIVGHLILTERSTMKRLGVTDLPDLPAGFEQRFARDEQASSKAEFGDVSILRPMWNDHRNRLIEAVRRTPIEQLDKPLEQPHPRFNTLAQMLLFMSIHPSMHAGQISTIRRSLGRPPLM